MVSPNAVPSSETGDTINGINGLFRTLTENPLKSSLYEKAYLETLATLRDRFMEIDNLGQAVILRVSGESAKKLETFDPLYKVTETVAASSNIGYDKNSGSFRLPVIGNPAKLFNVQIQGTQTAYVTGVYLPRMVFDYTYPDDYWVPIGMMVPYITNRQGYGYQKGVHLSVVLNRIKTADVTAEDIVDLSSLDPSGSLTTNSGVIYVNPYGLNTYYHTFSILEPGETCNL